MSRRKGRIADRFLAILLSVMLVVAMLPTVSLPVIAATDKYPDSFTISITDGTSPLEGVNVELSAKEAEWSLELSVTTDSDGVAVFETSDIDQALSDAGIDAGTIVYTASKTGYDNATGEVEVTVADLAINSDVVMTETQIDTNEYTLSVTVSSGDAVVKLNGVEQNSITVDANVEVAVEITPVDGSYIKSLSLRGEDKVVTKGEAYCDTIIVDQDIAIVLDVVKEYTVTLNKTEEGGTIRLDGNEISTVTVDENTSVELEVVADTGYQISSVAIGGVAQTITDEMCFRSSITVTSDTEVNVTFVKVYIITVIHTENGTVVTEPTTEGGSVTVESGETVIITADPDENYRVSEVVINDEADSDVTGENYSSIDTYVKQLTADKDYTIKIIFAPNRYEVAKEDLANGTIDLSTELVDYGGYCDVTVTPNSGYSVSSIQVDGVDVEAFEENEEGVVTFTISNITDATSISAAFVQTATVSHDIAGLFNYTDAIRIDGMTFIYENDGKITFTTDKTGIRIYNEKNLLVAGGKNIQSFTLDESVTISKIQLRYKAEGEWTKKWHTVEGVSTEALLKLIIDTNATSSIVTPEERHSNNFYNDDFEIGIKATDSGDYSGIGSIEYFVTDIEIAADVTYEAVSEDIKTQCGALYTYTDTIKDTHTAVVKVDVEEDKNNSDYVAVWFKITDLAGNVEYVRTENYLVNCTAPVLNSVSIDGTLHNEAKAGYYNNERTVTLVITDRASSFDAALVNDGININAIDADGKIIPISKPAMVSWSSNGDVHTAKILFDSDANYTWAISYVNLAGKTMDKSAVVEKGDSIYAFAIDTKAPSGSIEFDENNVWYELLSKLTFGIWDDSSITATAKAKDEISPTYDVLYYKSNLDSVLTETELKNLFINNREEFGIANNTVSAEEKIVIYARITDYAGNTLYISTNGAIVDTTDSKISINPVPANDNGFYNDDVKVDVSVSEIIDGHNVYSGIKTIDYRVEDNGVKKQEGNLYTFDIENPTYEQLVSDWSDSFIVKAGTGEGENNSDNVKIIVTVEDNAGNKYSKEKIIAINVDELSASIDMDGEGKVVDGYGYFSIEKRTATIRLKDRASSFNAEAATAGIVISAKDKENKPIEKAYTISNWKSEGDEHTATVTFNTNAKYEWSFNYTNDADNMLETENITTGNSLSPYKFTVDNTPPTGTVTVNENMWDKLLNVLTFGLYSKVKADVSATATDNISPVFVEYYKTSNPIAMKWEQLDKVTFEKYEDFSIEADEQFVVYLKITDYAGNYTYINSDGYIVDKVASTITLIPSTANGFYDTDANNKGTYGFYNSASDVTVDIKVEDAEPYSGIKLVEYWVENNNVETQRATLYSYDYTRESGEGNGKNTNGGTAIITDWNSVAQKNTAPINVSGKHPVQAELTKSWNGKIVVDKRLNNSCNVVVYVKTVDNAGNENIKSVKLDIDETSPSISVSFDNGNDNNGNTYFDAQRVATVVITERVHHFDASAATAGIVINAIDAEGKAVENAYKISNWTTVENKDNPDASTHTATISFAKDANYTWSIAYTDKAGNANSEVNTSVTNGTSVAAFDFTVDTTKPTGTIKAMSTEGRETEWNILRNDLTFGFWSKDKITLSGTVDDLTSAQIYSIEYYKVKATSATDGTTALTSEQLDAIKNWTALTAKVQTNTNGVYYSYDGLAVSTDEQFVVYVKLTDLAGNYTYISTNGLIVDHTAPLEETIAPMITVTPEQPINGIYNGDVKVDIKVIDPLVGGTYAGLNTITYKVFNMDVETQSGELFTFNKENPKQNDLVQTWTGSITVDSKLNNSNEVKIVIYAKDNSMNSSEGKVTIKVDVTAPLIDISYDNNNADNEKFFKENRTATIIVTERNFNAEDVNVTITNTDGVVPAIAEWTKVEGTGNQDNTKWVATILYSADGDYTFNIAYTDLAGNQCTSISYGNSVAATEFTVDKTLPVISVSYNNNNAANGNYFAQARTATITITEHNFDVNRVVFTQNASLNGNNIAIPTISWRDDGDVHTATIVYSADGDYAFDVTMTDIAGNKSGEANYGNSVAGKEFVVDQTIEKPTVGGVENGKAYTGDVIPTISFNDVNYASYEITLVRTRMGDKNVNVTEEFINSISEKAQGGSGTYDTFEKVVENDGIYTLTVKMVDKAGNEKIEEVTFTVNRFGSVYEYSDYLVSLIKDGGQYITISDGNKAAITEDLVITEYNADRLLEGSLKILITRDGEALDVDFDMTPVEMNTEATIGESGWYEYVYNIKASNFVEDGVYKISLSSAYETVDSDSNESTSVPENSIDENGNQIIDTMNFTVDTTAPEIRNIVNLDNRNGIADKDKISDDGLKVSYTIVDVGGLKSIEILLNGKVHETITEFGNSMFNYNGNFYIPESSKKQNVQIIVTDIAGNVTDTSSDDFDTKGIYVFNNEVLVSRNFWIRFINNPVLLWGSIGGATVVLGAVGYFITARRKRKNK